MRAIGPLIIFFLLSYLGVAQVRLTGEVRHGDEGLDKVTIKVIENDKVLRTLAVNRRGKYETEIPFDKQYTLVFTRPFMFPVSIDIDTRMFEALPETVYDVPLNMNMFYRFSGMDEKPFDQHIGSIKKTGQGEDAFSFTPNQEVIDRLKLLQNESEARYLAGEDPIEQSDQPELNKTYEAFQEQELPAKAEPESSRAKADATVPTKKVEESELDKAELDIAAQKRHHEQHQQVNDLSRSAQRSSLEGQRSSLIQEESRVHQDIDQSKDAKRSWAEKEEEQAQLLAKARVDKHDRLSGLGVGDGAPSRVKDKTDGALVLVDFRKNDGVWLSEERLLVTSNGKRIEYIKARYDWLFFEVVTCSKNGEEIAEQEYEQVKALVGI